MIRNGPRRDVCATIRVTIVEQSDVMERAGAADVDLCKLESVDAQGVSAMTRRSFERALSDAADLRVKDVLPS